SSHCMWWHLAIAALVTGSAAITMMIIDRAPRARIGPGPGPECVLPARACTASDCAELVEMPTVGEGYMDVRLDGELTSEAWTSYLRRDLMLLVRYAAAKVACKAHDWRTGNGGPIVLGDMSERDGSTPGTWYGLPRHPVNTHVDGRDIDIAY